MKNHLIISLLFLSFGVGKVKILEKETKILPFIYSVTVE
jgi:hypothetical protein